MNDTVQPREGGNGKEHCLTAKARESIAVTGVSEVVSFDEANVRLVTSCGILNLEGEGLRIHVLSTREGTVSVTGKLNGVLYEEPGQSSVPEKKARARRFFGS